MIECLRTLTATGGSYVPYSSCLSGTVLFVVVVQLLAIDDFRFETLVLLETVV